ncbi:MAG TPA: hypothetical protein VJH04_02180 [archaeon]|nr:hypothetical protein [archaeon]
MSLETPVNVIIRAIEIGLYACDATTPIDVCNARVQIQELRRNILSNSVEYSVRYDGCMDIMLKVVKRAEYAVVKSGERFKP